MKLASLEPSGRKESWRISCISFLSRSITEGLIVIFIGFQDLGIALSALVLDLSDLGRRAWRGLAGSLLAFQQ